MIINRNNFLIFDDGFTGSESDLPEGYIWHDTKCAYMPLLVYGEALRFYINTTAGLNYLIPNPSIVSLKLVNSRTSQVTNFIAPLQQDIFTNDAGEEDYTFFAEVVINNSLPNGEYYFLIGNNTSDFLTSNLVKVITSGTDYTKNTARVTFRHDRYYYGFNYQSVTTFTQQFRLHLNEIDSQGESDRDVYKEITTGYRRVYNEFKDRIKKVEGYYFDKYAHEAADVLFGHSVVLINGKQYQAKNTWQPQRDVTQKKYKGIIELYDLGFSTIARCLDAGSSAGGSGSGGVSCEAVSMENITLPAAVVDTLYQFSFTVDGDLPITKTDNTVPSWATATISGRVVTIEGTPTTAGEDDVDLTFENCGGETLPFVGTIEVLASGVFNITYQTVTNNSCQSVIRATVYATVGDSLTIGAPVVQSGFMDSWTIAFFPSSLPATANYIRPIFITVTLDNGNGTASVVTFNIDNNTTAENGTASFIRNNTGAPC